MAEPSAQSYILSAAALALSDADRDRARNLFQQAIKLCLHQAYLGNLVAAITNFSSLSPLPIQRRLRELSLTMGRAIRADDEVFVALMQIASTAVTIGDHVRADDIFADLAQREPPSPRAMYRPGDLERRTIYYAYCLGTLTEAALAAGDDAARAGNNRYAQRELATLRGRWLLSQGQAHAAIAPLQSAIAMARHIDREDSIAEATLALARLRHGEKDLQPDPARWDRFGSTAALYIAWFWQERGERDRVLASAMRAFRDAHDPGEPFVYRWEADNARALLDELGEPVPEIPPYDAAADPPYPWEAEVRALIAKLEAENAAKAKQEPKPALKRQLRRRKPPR